MLHAWVEVIWISILTIITGYKLHATCYNLHAGIEVIWIAEHILLSVATHRHIFCSSTTSSDKYQNQHTWSSLSPVVPEVWVLIWVLWKTGHLLQIILRAASRLNVSALLLTHGWKSHCMSHNQEWVWGWIFVNSYRFTWVAPHHSLSEPCLLHRVRHIRVHCLQIQPFIHNQHQFDFRSMRFKVTTCIIMSRVQAVRSRAASLARPSVTTAKPWLEVWHSRW